MILVDIRGNPEYGDDWDNSYTEVEKLTISFGMETFRSEFDQVLLNQEASGVKINDEKPRAYTMKDGRQLKGMEFRADYTRQDKKFRQWVAILTRPSGEAFYVWSYTAPDDLYDTYYGTAQLMLDSWVIS